MLALTIAGLVLCIAHSAMFSGLNLAAFGISRLRLEVAAETGDIHAKRVLALRNDANFLLTTILWGNVSVNVLLALLADSILTGAVAFVFSTFVITYIGEILPQAYFSRNAMNIASRFAPVIRLYQLILYPLAKPSAWMLDKWLGEEGAHYLREEDLLKMIELHAEKEGTDISEVEGQGALNFLLLDDLPVAQEGEPIDPDSIIVLPTVLDLPTMPEISRSPDDPFLRKLDKSGRKWAILTNKRGDPLLVADVDALLRAALLGENNFEPYKYCHRPLVVRDGAAPIGHLLKELEVIPKHESDDVVDLDIILYWGSDEKRIITGADLLGRILRGIARTTDAT